jgi:hypothetical protein
VGGVVDVDRNDLISDGEGAENFQSGMKNLRKFCKPFAFGSRLYIRPLTEKA